MVYKLLLTDPHNSEIEFWNFGRDRCRPSLGSSLTPSLLATNRQIQRESAPILYQSTFQFECMRPLCLFVQLVGSNTMYLKQVIVEIAVLPQWHEVLPTSLCLERGLVPITVICFPAKGSSQECFGIALLEIFEPLLRLMIERGMHPLRELDKVKLEVPLYRCLEPIDSVEWVQGIGSHFREAVQWHFGELKRIGTRVTGSRPRNRLDIDA